MPTNPASGPAVSVIIPARNEEINLGACLESITAQTGISFEVIVVDDHSADRTAEIAHSYPTVRVMAAPDLTPGWTGKNNAVIAGTAAARGEWLLFTDADTVHLPGSLAASVAEAQQHEAALLSYSPRQIVKSLAERALMPLIFADLAATFRPSEVSNPDSPAAAANGQFILVRKEAYDAVGGHRAVAGEILEDVALARAFKRKGYKIFFRYGGDLIETRMYRSYAQLREGWTKNLALLFPEPQKLAAIRVAEFVMCVAGVVLSILGIKAHHPIIVFFGLLPVLISFVRLRLAHFPVITTIISFLGLPVFAYLLIRSQNMHKKHQITWKGREYSSQA